MFLETGTRLPSTSNAPAAATTPQPLLLNIIHNELFPQNPVPIESSGANGSSMTLLAASASGSAEAAEGEPWTEALGDARSAERLKELDEEKRAIEAKQAAIDGYLSEASSDGE